MMKINISISLRKIKVKIILIIFLICIMNFFQGSNSTLALIIINEGNFISNDQFVFHPSLYDYDIHEFLISHPGQLKELSLEDIQAVADTVQSISFFYSISPKVLIALLETQLFYQSAPIEGNHVQEQIYLAAEILSTEFYEDASVDLQGYTVVPPQASSQAIDFYLSQSVEIEANYEFQQGNNYIDKFVDIYTHKFGDPKFPTALSSSLSTQPDFHFPWLVDSAHWKVSGKLYHPGFKEFPPGSGLSNNPDVINDGIDFIPPIKSSDNRGWCPGPSDPNRPKYCSDSNRGISPNWVIASADGEVVYRNWSMVVVKHSPEWSTLYYHIAESEMANKGGLPPNMRIGHPSNATTWGGYSSPSHVHFSIAKGGILQFPRPYVENFSTWDGNTIGITLYEHANFSGKSLSLTDSDEDLCDNPLDPSVDPKSFQCFSGPSWNDIASSIKVAPGWRADIYLHSKDQESTLGEYYMSFNCNSDISDFSDPSIKFPNGASLNDNISRVIVAKCDGNSYQVHNNFSLNTSIQNDPCEPIAPPSTSDSATFANYETLPDGTVVSPGQVLTKTWRMRNAGSSTWGSGYQLAFVSGEQMGAPNAIDVPNTIPGQEVNLSINLTAPDSNGSHLGYWRMRNPSGTYFGDQIWVKIDVNAANPGGNITLFDLSPASPSSATSVHIVGRARYFSDFRSMRFVIGNEVHEMSNFRQVGDQIEISVDWNTSSLPRGEHAVVFEVAKNGDSDWTNAERLVKIYTLIGTPTSSNHPPDRPVLKSPYNWYLKDASGASASVELCVHPSSDPDGNPVQYYFEVKDQGGGVYANSGWVGSACWSRSYDPNTYSWRVKSGDGSAESDWSTETWNFSVAKGGVYIGDHAFFNLNTNDTHVCVFVTYDGIQGPEVKAWLNKAPDGSDNGEWRLLDHYGPNTTPDCTQPNYHGFWIRSPEYETGTHRLKISATKQDSGANANKETSMAITYIRPPSPTPLAPSSHENNGTWWNTRTINFEWSPALRTDNYTLRVSTNSNPWADSSPLLEQVFNSITTNSSHTISQDYGQLFWSVKASNSVGSADTGAGVWFGIDTVAPTCQIQTLPGATYESVFQVNWSGTDDSSGQRSYDVQYRDSHREGWNDWLVNHPADKPYELFVGQPGHTYYFRCRASDNAGNTGNYPGAPDTQIVVDPASRPQAPWWDQNYQYKRNLIVQNNMPAVTLTVGYPVLVQFTSGTVPSAAEIYNASLSSTKCDDFRIVHNDTVELDRIVDKCTSDEIVIWFRSQVSIDGGETDNTAHQLYYGNSAAVNPPAHRNQVFYPIIDSNHLRVFDMREGSGLTLQDATGNGAASMSSELSWSSNGKFGPAVLLPGDLTPEPRPAIYAGYGPQPSCAFTAELWMRRLTGHQYGGQLIQQEIGGPNPWRWAFTLNGSGLLELSVEGTSSSVIGSRSLNDPTFFNNWHHLAVTHSCSGQVRFYIDGILDATRTMSNGNVNPASAPLRIGNNAYNTQRLAGYVFGVAVSNVVRTDFSYGTFGNILTEPALAAGQALMPPVSGSPDLVILSVSTYPNPDGGELVEAVVHNQGDLSTQNGFYTDLYIDHLPTGAGDYSSSLRFWVNDPIDPGQTVTLTTLLTSLPAGTQQLMSAAAETSGMLYAQTDSSGVVPEPDNQNNIFTSGVRICLANPDNFESDDSSNLAPTLVPGQSQRHNFDTLDDQDWVKFSAQAGEKYQLFTSDLDISSDTYLYLYDKDATTLLVSNDDFDGELTSQIEWQAPTTGIYYAKVRHWNPNVGGCGTSYTIQLRPVDSPILPSVWIYLPTIFK